MEQHAVIDEEPSRQEELQQRITSLEHELQQARAELQAIDPSYHHHHNDEDRLPEEAGENKEAALYRPSHSDVRLSSPSKRGYLFKWADRWIGWGGSKWRLRFVVLEHGRLSYYLSHDTLDAGPRYVLTLRGCAVRDDGWKRNRRHTWRGGGTAPHAESPPLDEPGAYFFVFSVYERSQLEDDQEETSSEEVVPLLRFSSPSLAEKMQWIQLISNACEYCETDAFLEDELSREDELSLQRQQQTEMARAMPEARDGTLAPLYFGTPKIPPALQPSASVPRSLGSAQRGHSSGSSSGLRRNQSFSTKSSDANLERVEAKSKRSYPPSKPMHRSAQPSYLSPEGKAQNFRGLFNLGILILLVANLRLFMDAVQNHGFLAMTLDQQTLPTLARDPLGRFPFATGFVMLKTFVTAGYIIESLLSHKQMDEELGMILHYLTAHSSLVIPSMIVWKFVKNPVYGGILLFYATITWMKLISYIQANEDYRHALRGQPPQEGPSRRLVENLDPNEAEIQYPQNVTLGNMMYFWYAPTLTYQIAFPKYPQVRWWKVWTIVGRMVMVLALSAFLVAQFVRPTLEGIVDDLEKANGRFTGHIFAEYWLKLSITSTYLWLLMFYGYFHLYLNLFAELLRFGDRCFYLDWWNSADCGAFWRLWNMPVHFWMVRHVFFPCLRLKMTSFMATMVVFCLSAIIHELLVSVPFHMIRPWSFLGMMAQLPLIFFTKFLYRRFPGSSIGNFVFWISFCVVGQPMAILLYAVDYEFKRRNPDVDDIDCRLLSYGHCWIS